MTVDKSSDSRYGEPDVITIGSITSIDSYKNPLRVAYKTGLKHDEVYRFAVVFTNTKGQDSFIKWIGDIKTPTVLEYPLCVVSGARTAKAHPLGIKFTINTTGLSAFDVVGMRIVMVERKKEDRTIYSQGIISHMFLDDSCNGSDIYDQLIVGYPRAVIKTPTEGVVAGKFIKQTTVVQFISPEVNYFKDLSPQSTDYIKLVSRLVDRTTYMCCVTALSAKIEFEDYGINERTHAVGASTFPLLYNTDSWINVSKYLTTGIIGLTDLYTYNIREGIMSGPVEYGGEKSNIITLPTSPSGKGILNRSIDFNPGTSLPDHEGISGTCAILILGTDVDNSFLVSADELEIYLVDYKRPGIAASQYGGLTYEARQSNTYIECSSYIPITGGSDVITMYGGDSYIDFHEHLRTMWEVDDNDGDTVADVTTGNRFASIISFPCESQINLGLTHGHKFSKDYISTYAHALREDMGTYNGDLVDHTMPCDDYDFIQDKNMYEYNSVYSQKNISKIYFSKPLNWLSTVHDDTLVKISLEKVAREEVDSFVKFLSDNKKTLPTQYGPINDLFLFKNYVIVFMDHAFGSLSVDERVVLPVQNNSLLELGSADNLKYFDFISNSSGSIHPTSINKIGDGFGWFDAHLNSFGYYNGQTQDLGLVKGISSDIKIYCDNIKHPSTGVYYTNQFYGGNFLTYENKKYKESICAMIVSELADWDSNTATESIFTLAYAPVSCHNTIVVINGLEYYADIVSASGVGTLTINTTDNPSLIPALYSAGKYFIFYKDLSRIFTFNSVLNTFQHEVEINPQHLIEYNDDLFEITYNKVFYQLNEGNYGEFYDIYRKGEIEYIINPQRSYVCIFNNYEYAMEAIASDGTNTVNETWSSLKISNDYQYSIGLPIDTTFTHATNKFTTIVPHGLKIDDELMLSGTIPTGFDSTIIYYVIEITTFTFRLSTSKGGTAEVLTNTGTCYYNLLDAPLIINTFSSTGNIMRRMRTWRIKDLRDRNSTKPRIRDTYVRLLFKYQHGSNKRIIMHDLYTYYSLSRESMGE